MAVNQLISNFNTVASQKDFSRNNLYRLMSLKTRALELDESDLIYCRGAQIPGRENPSASVNFHGMEFRYPKSTVKYDGSSYTLKFLLDANGDLRRKFEEASRIIFNDQSNTCNWRFPGATDQIVIAQLGLNMEPIKIYTLYGVCITKIEAYDSDFTGEGEAVEISVTFTYNYYKTDGSEVIYSE
jgi:hypothetical protein